MIVRQQYTLSPGSETTTYVWYLSAVVEVYGEDVVVSEDSGTVAVCFTLSRESERSISIDLLPVPPEGGAFQPAEGEQM